MSSEVSILATTSNKQPTFESTSNAPPETGEGRKTLNCLPNETIWRRWMIEAGGLKVFGRGVAERKRDGGKKRCREKQQRSYIYETMSWVPLCRQDDNYRAQAKKPWLGKKRDIQAAGLPPLGPQDNHNAKQQSYSIGYESRVEDHWRRDTYGQAYTGAGRSKYSGLQLRGQIKVVYTSLKLNLKKTWINLN